MTTRCPFSDPQDPVSRVSKIRGQGPKSQEGKHLKHAQVGDLHIKFAAFTVNGAPHQQLVVYQAEPASPTAAAFETLRSMGTQPKQARAEATDASM